MTRFQTRLRSVLRWARAHQWRPVNPGVRHGGVYMWTNEVPDPGGRKQPTLRILVHTGGTVEIAQRFTGAGWVTIGWARVGFPDHVLDLLAAHYVIPGRFATDRFVPPPPAGMVDVLAVIRNALRTGSYMTKANGAFQELCARLGVDPDDLVFNPAWIPGR